MCFLIDRAVSTTFRSGLPASWRTTATLEHCATPTDLLAFLRSKGTNADELARHLIVDGSGEATLMLVAASIPYVKAWAKGDREYESEALTEVAIVVGEVRLLDELPADRHVLTMIVDLACDRQRKRRWRERPPVPVSGLHPIWERADAVAGPEEVAIGRLAVREVQRDLLRRPYAADGAVEAWNTVVQLLNQDRRTQEDRNRLGHGRRRLRRLVDPQLVA